MPNITEDAIRSLQTFGCTNKTQAEKALRSWVRRDKLSSEQRKLVIESFGKRRA